MCIVAKTCLRRATGDEHEYEGDGGRGTRDVGGDSHMGRAQSMPTVLWRTIGITVLQANPNNASLPPLALPDHRIAAAVMLSFM